LANIQTDISDADLSKAASEAARILTPKVILAFLAEFGVKGTQDLKDADRHKFVDGLKAAIAEPRGGKPRKIGGVADEPPPPEGVHELIKRYGLTWDYRQGLGSNKHLFLKIDHDNQVAPPLMLPSITHADDIYFLIPAGAGTDLLNHLLKSASPQLSYEVANEGEAFIPESAVDWTINSKIDNATILEAIDKHRDATWNARRARDAKELLEREREPRACLYASAAHIDETTPMLIEGLMRESGVSVIYGDFDEFKTTLVLDMMAHVAAGAPWQGRKVMPRPVIWYALEGSDDIPVRLRALEASLKDKNTSWGNDCMPITALDRIPEDYRKWRAEISSLAERWENIYSARWQTGEMPMETIGAGTKDAYEDVRYPSPDAVDGPRPVVVIDTLSIALGGEDEKGARAVGFIGNCLDLLKEQPEMRKPDFSYLSNGSLVMDEIAEAEWKKQHPGETGTMDAPVASHIIIIHHQTKTGTEFAGHRAIAGNTQALYRVHRFGKITDVNRPYAGMLTPRRVKDVPRPSPIRFDVDVVPIAETKRTAAILKDSTTAIPIELKPVIEALRGLENPQAIPPADLNDCLDVEAAKGAKDGPAKRKARQRCREKLEVAGVIEPVEDDNGNVAFYRFHDTTVA